MWAKPLGLILVLVGTPGWVMASGVVPEIGGPASGVAAVALLCGAILVIRGRRKPGNN